MKQNTIKVVFTNKASSRQIPSGTRMLVRRACTAVLRLENYTEDAAIGVTFVRKKGLSAVPAFAIGAVDEPFRITPCDGALGMLYFSLDETSRAAALHNRPQQTELAYLTVKATLLLLGYSDHAELESKTEWIMHCFGMPITTKYAVLQYA